MDINSSTAVNSNDYTVSPSLTGINTTFNENDTNIFNMDASHTQHDIYKLAMLLVKVVFPALVVVGTIGNTMVIVVLRRGAINTDNLSFFLSALALVDMVFLFTSAFKTWLRVMWGFELLHFDSWSCKLGLFLNHLSLTLSAWLVVVIAWQRWYTCSRPFDRCCPVESTKCGYIGLASLIIILVGANSYILVTVELHQDEYGSVCAPGEKYDRAISEIFPYVLIVLYSGIPALLLLGLNALLARVLYISRRSLLSHSDSAMTSGRNDGHVRNRYNYVTALLMVLSVSWFLLTTPHTILKMVEHIPESSQEAATHTFLNVLFFVFLYINHSINFFLYCALTRGFRREVQKMASGVASSMKHLSNCCCRQQQRLQSIDMNSSVNHSHNRNSNTDSFLPLLAQRYLRPSEHNGYYHRRGKTDS